MRKYRFIILAFLFTVVFPFQAAAQPLDYGGGVNDEYEYEEYVFINGEPIKFVGTYTVTENDRGNLINLSYRFNLEPEDKRIDGKISRRISYEISKDKYSEKGQTVASTNVKSYRETIEIGEDKYSLEDYQISESKVVDNRPASDYYLGTMTARKIYEINRDEGRVTVQISGGNVGYKNFWGKTDTQILDYNIYTDRDIQIGDDSTEHISWSGTVRVSVSDSLSKSLNYKSNSTSLSSFSGGYYKVSKQDTCSKYDYDMPMISGSNVSNRIRNRNSVSITRTMLPRVEYLIIPRLRDIGGHPAENDIKKLYSLDVFRDNSDFFIPEAPMVRGEFVKALVNASHIEKEVVNTRSSSYLRQQPLQEISPFYDLPTSHPDYEFIKEALRKGIISGANSGYFHPDEKISRAEAITMIIRALGFENNAPAPGYYCGFADDYDIPDWAKDSIYVAKEIGLVNGDIYGRINPNEILSRSEASTMLVRYLEFLERDLQRDYREDIMLYY